MIKGLELIWGHVLQALELHLLEVFLALQALTREFLLDLLLEGGSCLRFSQI